MVFLSLPGLVLVVVELADGDLQRRGVSSADQVPQDCGERADVGEYG